MVLWLYVKKPVFSRNLGYIYGVLMNSSDRLDRKLKVRKTWLKKKYICKLDQWCEIND